MLYYIILYCIVLYYIILDRICGRCRLDCETRGVGRNALSEGGMVRLETLVELKFLNSIFSSLSSC